MFLSNDILIAMIYSYHQMHLLNIIINNNITKLFFNNYLIYLWIFVDI